MNTTHSDFKPGLVAGTLSAVEWSTRQDLAAAYRLAHHFGWSELIYNHITSEIADQPGAFLINPMGLRYDEVTASNLIKIDADGKILSPTAFGLNRAGYVIHSAIHAARTDAQCVMHTHSRAGIAVATLESGLQPMTQSGMQFYDRVAYHSYEGFNVNLDERARLAANLGTYNAMILRSHGLVTIGTSIGKAFQRMYFFEQACQTMLDALSMGEKVITLQPDVLEATARKWSDGTSDASANDELEWRALLRLADRFYPDYRL